MKKLLALLTVLAATLLTACELEDMETSSTSQQAVEAHTHEQSLIDSGDFDIPAIIDITTFPGYQGHKQAEVDALRDDIAPELRSVVGDALLVNGCHPWVTAYKECGLGMYDGDGNNANSIPGYALRNAESAQWKHSIWLSNELFYQRTYDPVYVINHEAVHAWIHHVLEPCGLAEEAIERFTSGRFDHREAFAAEEELTDAITVFLLGNGYETIYRGSSDLTADESAYIASLFERC